MYHIIGELFPWAKCGWLRTHFFFQVFMSCLSFCPSLCLCHLRKVLWFFFLFCCFYAVICSYLCLHLHVKICSLTICSFPVGFSTLTSLCCRFLEWNHINIPGVPCSSIHSPSLGPFLCCLPSQVSGYFSRSLQGPAVSHWWPDLFTSWLSWLRTM